MATTPEGLIPELLMQHLAGLLFNPPLKVAWPNRAFEPKKNETYLEADYLPNANRTLFLSADDETEHIGLFQVTVVSPIDEGIIKPVDVAGQVVAHFAGTTVLRPQGDAFTIKIYEKPSVAASFIDDARQAVRTPVTIPWRAFI